MKIDYGVSKPVPLSDHFEIPVDRTHWDGSYCNIPYTNRNGRNRHIHMPKREPSMPSKKLLTPITDLGHKMGSSYGIYLLFFRRDNVYYPGIATMNSKSPEGILERLRKHRAKATATVHTDKKEINHTGRWREFAHNRWRENAKEFHSMSDCMVSICTPRNHVAIVDGERQLLEAAEDSLADVQSPMLKKFVATGCLDDSGTVECMARTRRGKTHDMSFHFWDGSIIRP